MEVAPTEHIDTIAIDTAKLARGLEIIDREKHQSMRTVLSHHWKALVWGITLSLALVMDGYDGSIAYSFYALPAFANRFGSPTVEKGKTVNRVSANWQTLISLILLPGNVLALYFVGWSTERFGFRYTYMFGMALVTGLIFLYFFLQSIQMMVVASALSGFCWALFHTLSAGYSVEICPISIRGIATSFISFAWGAGSFIATGVIRACLGVNGDLGWKIPYAVQWVWPVPLFFLAYLAPENPYWLVRKGRREDAKRVVARLATKGYYSEEDLDALVTHMEYTNELERARSANASFLDMFKGSNLRRTNAMVSVWAIQQFAGLSLTGQATQFLKEAGMKTVAAFNFGLIINAMNLVGCAAELLIIGRFRRRLLLFIGQGVLAVCLLVIGILGTTHPNKHTNTTIGGLLALINLFFHATTGPVTYTQAAEIPSTRLRQRSIAFGRIVYNLLGAVNGQLVVRMINPKSNKGWNWKAKTGFFYLGTNLLTSIWGFFTIPETAGLTFAELEILYENKVSPRKFSKATVQNLPQESHEHDAHDFHDAHSISKDDKAAQTVVDVQEV